MPFISSPTMNQPDSDHTELYYTDLEDEGQPGQGFDREDSSSSDSEGEREYELKCIEKKAGKGAAEYWKGKGVAFTDAEPNIPFIGHDRPSKEKHENRSWYDLDLSLIVALVSPIGNWLTGSDHVKNLFLILLLIFYLHQLIESTLILPVLSYFRLTVFDSALAALSCLTTQKTL